MGEDQALGEARALNAQILAKGLTASRPSEVARTLQWRQMALTSEAILTALDHYIAQGGGSRGARAICDPNGDALPQSVHGPLPDVRFRAERDADKHSQLRVRLDGTGMKVSEVPNRAYGGDKSFFERDWPAWLNGEIYDRDAANP